MATDFYTNAFADNYRLAKSRIIVSPSTATYNVIRIPKYAFVSDVWIQVVIATNVEPDACSVVMQLLRLPMDLLLQKWLTPGLRD
jgi:hypothetical protein